MKSWSGLWLLLVKEGEVPLIHPFQKGEAIAELDGEPHIGGVDGFTRVPPVGHENESLLSACHGKDKGTLGVEGEVGIGAGAGVGVTGPGPPDGGGREQACRIGIPPRASRGDHEILPLLFEDGRSFIMSSGIDPDPFSGITEIIIGQFGQVKGKVFLGSIDMVSLTVVVGIKGHIA